MRRITPEECQMAFKETKLTPERNIYFRNGCGCGLTAMLMSAGGDPGRACAEYAASILSLESPYAYGFSGGFDGHPNYGKKHADYFDRSYSIGHADGLSAAALVFGEAPKASVPQ